MHRPRPADTTMTTPIPMLLQRSTAPFYKDNRQQCCSGVQLPNSIPKSRSQLHAAPPLAQRQPTRRSTAQRQSTMTDPRGGFRRNGSSRGGPRRSGADEDLLAGVVAVEAATTTPSACPSLAIRLTIAELDSLNDLPLPPEVVSDQRLPLTFPTNAPVRQSNRPRPELCTPGTAQQSVRRHALCHLLHRRLPSVAS